MEFCGGVESQAEIVDLYLKQTTEQLEQIAAASKEGNATRMSRVAHSCAGASATCGMTVIVPLLRQLERVAAEDDLVATPELIKSIEVEFARIKAFLENSACGIQNSESDSKAA